MAELEYFDLISYLTDRGIEYKDGGKDVGVGWVGINCPFPGCSDHSKHLGIHKTKKTIHCWICGVNGNVRDLIVKLENCSYSMADVIIGKYVDYFPEEQSTRRAAGRIVKVLPEEEICSSFPLLHLQYIQRRNFDPQKIISTYGIKAVYNIGKYRMRLIIPIYLKGRVVTFIARDITGNTDLKYVNCPIERSIIPVNETLYNIDRVKGDRAVLVEGALDVWRLGPGAIASYSAKMIEPQKKLLVDKGIKKLFVMYDPEPMAQKKAREIAEEMSPFMKTEIITLKEGDPGDLNPVDAKILMQDLMGG